MRQRLVGLLLTAVLGAAVAVPATSADSRTAGATATDTQHHASTAAKRGSRHRRLRLTRRRVAAAHVPVRLLPRPDPSIPALLPADTTLPATPVSPGGSDPSPLPPSGSPPPGVPADPPVTPACKSTVSARLAEWSITLSRLSVCSGPVTVQAQNYGSDPHDMWLQRTDGSGVTTKWEPSLAAASGTGGPGGVATKAVTMTPGTYQLFCSLTGGTPSGTPRASHDAAGMHATLTVIAP